MSEKVRTIAEGLARKTPRRRLLGRTAEVFFAALTGTAAGVAVRQAQAGTHEGTDCAFPGEPCICEHCQSSGVCAKPCVILTTFYNSGCWVEQSNNATCCDCACPRGVAQITCGCGSDYHNDPAYCPNGNATAA